MKDKVTIRWAIAFAAIFLIFFAVVTWKMIHIQATGQVDGFNLETWATRQRTHEQTIESARGNIYDRHEIALAQDLLVYRLYAVVDESISPYPERRIYHVDDIQNTAAKLAPIINREEEDLVEVLQRGREDGRFQVEFGREGSELTREQKLEIEALSLPGIHFIEHRKRFYPNGNFASHVIGLAQLNDDQEITGLTGIEAQLNEFLTGQDGRISYQRDRYQERLVDASEQIVERQDGYNVKLTIDQKVQTILEDALAHVESEFEPESVTATVVDPKTGEIIAMGSRPSYDPNQLGDVQNWYNDVISTPIEPGSTMKVFTIAAAIEEGLYNPDEKYMSGTYKIPEIIRPVPDYRRHWGEITYSEGFQRSSNVMASKLVWEKLGPAKFLEYIKAFHLDEPSGIDLPREQTGRLVYRYPIEQLNAAFGQGTTVTPIQMLKAATAIANEGKMMTPYVIKEITDAHSGDVIQQTEPTEAGRPISAETAKKVLEEMEKVVTGDVGTARNVFHLPSYTLAGKTGTAQISGGSSGYLTGRENYIFSFIGVAPADEPELLMYVTVKQPQLEDTEAGSKPVAFIFNHVMENALHYLNIQPDKEHVSQITETMMPVHIGLETSQVESKLIESGISPIVIGHGDQIVKSNMEAGSQVISTEDVMLITDEPTMPDITGWSIRRVNQLSHLIGLDLEVVGSGYVTHQSIEEGSRLESGRYLLADFSAFELEEEDSEDETNQEDV